MSLHYDYIICGAGCAGLSLAYRLCDKAFSGKKILLLDRDQKQRNDRTWSFWTKEQPYFHEIIYKSWQNLAFHSPGFTMNKPMLPYAYHTIRGIDFYNHVLETIRRTEHLEFKLGEIGDIRDGPEGGRVTAGGHTYTGGIIFDSTVNTFPQRDKLFVWQHFRGWVIRTSEDTFNDDEVTFMDFRIPQEKETRFIYILPWDKKTALVEATLFTKTIASPNFYDDLLRDYCARFLKIDHYEIVETEMGAIPMTTSQFKKSKKHVIPIGTANAIVKASSGYAFHRIQKESDWLVHQLKSKGRPPHPYRPRMKFKWYDRTLLHVLLTGKRSASDIFSTMFRKNEVQSILKFLDEETSFQEEARIFAQLPFWPFLTGFLAENVLKLKKE